MPALMLFSAIFSVTVSAAEKDGGYIVLPENAGIRLTAAADTLSKYLNRITDKAYPVANDGVGIKFVIDYTFNVTDNGCIITISETVVSIKDSGVRGVIHSVYVFIEEYCTCENCKAIDDANGAHSGTMITFVNRIAREVKSAGYDNAAIDTFACKYTR